MVEVFALPVSVEQIAVVVRQMNQADQYHLLELVPNLRHLASQPATRTKEEARKRVEQLRKKWRQPCILSYCPLTNRF